MSMVELHIDVRRESSEFVFVPYLQNADEVLELPTFKLDERLCNLGLLAEFLKHHPYGEWKDWVEKLVNCSCQYSRNFFLTRREIQQHYDERIETKSGCSVIVQIHRRYLGCDYDEARLTLSMPLEFLHPRYYDQTPTTDSGRTEWIKDIFPLKYPVEIWIVGDRTTGYGEATSQYPNLSTLTFDPAEGKVLLIASYPSGAGKKIKKIKESIDAEVDRVSKHYARYFKKYLEEHLHISNIELNDSTFAVT